MPTNLPHRVQPGAYHIFGGASSLHLLVLRLPWLPGSLVDSPLRPTCQSARPWARWQVPVVLTGRAEEAASSIVNGGRLRKGGSALDCTPRPPFATRLNMPPPARAAPLPAKEGITVSALLPLSHAT